jgi:transcriptional regulator with XRE-family HTH domain
VFVVSERAGPGRAAPAAPVLGTVISPPELSGGCHEEGRMAVLMREAIGASLRRIRTTRRRTLRDVSRRARVSLGYLSEVERGRKEPSSELLAAICDALDVALADLLSDAAEALDAAAAADAATARPQRLVGLRHMDLRLAGSEGALAAPLGAAPVTAPLSPVAPVSAQPAPQRAGTVRAAA